MIKLLLRSILLSQLLFVIIIGVRAEDGYELWLRYAPIPESAQIERVAHFLSQVSIKESSETARVIRAELDKAAKGRERPSP